MSKEYKAVAAKGQVPTGFLVCLGKFFEFEIRGLCAGLRELPSLNPISRRLATKLPSSPFAPRRYRSTGTWLRTHATGARFAIVVPVRWNCRRPGRAPGQDR